MPNVHINSPLRTHGAACRDKTPSALYFKYNTQLGPPYQVLVDTNFINFSIRNKARPTLVQAHQMSFMCTKQCWRRRGARVAGLAS